MGEGRKLTVFWRGKNVDVELVSIDERGHELEVGAAAAWKQMCWAAEVDGLTLKARTAFRSFEYQRLLRQAYEAYQQYLAAVKAWEDSGKVEPEPARVPWAALANPPGTSTHEIGNAVDIEGTAQVGSPLDVWLRANAEKFGWRRTVPSENWHYNWIPDEVSHV